MHSPRDPARFRSLLSQIMEDADLTQQDVATLAGISRPQVSRWLSGDHRPGFDALQQFAAALQESYPAVATAAAELVRAAGYAPGISVVPAPAVASKTYPAGARQSLGHSLLLRRLQLEYPKLRQFVRDRKPAMGQRMVAKIENGEVDNFPASLLAAIDELYELAPGSAERSLENWKPEPADDDSGTVTGLTPDEARAVRTWVEFKRRSQQPNGEERKGA